MFADRLIKLSNKPSLASEFLSWILIIALVTISTPKVHLGMVTVRFHGNAGLEFLHFFFNIILQAF
jgi:hypothetical protein